MLVLMLLLAAASADPRRTPVVQAVERAAPAVVTLDVEVVDPSPFRFFGARTSASEGSGVIIHGSGIVLTNAHVVDGASRVTVHGTDGQQWTADVLALDTALDLAVLQIPSVEGLPVISVGDSDDLLLGEPAIALGNAYGLGMTVSTGVVASVGRDMHVGSGPVQTYIQTDAAINPGNSGGALVNIHGELIGINTFIHQSAEGIGFAIPVNRARKIAEDLLNHGEVKLPWLGLDLVDVGPRRLRGLPAGAILVDGIHRVGPAHASDLEVGDLIVELGGHPTVTRADLNARMAERASGDPVTLGIIRDGTPTTTRLAGIDPPADLGRLSRRQGLGIEVQAAGDALRITRMTTSGGAAVARLQAGDLLVAIDGVRIRTPAELEAQLARIKAQHRSSATLVVVRDRTRGAVNVGI